MSCIGESFLPFLASCLFLLDIICTSSFFIYWLVVSQVLPVFYLLRHNLPGLFPLLLLSYSSPAFRSFSTRSRALHQLCHHHRCQRELRLRCRHCINDLC